MIKSVMLIDDNPVDNYISDTNLKRIGFAETITIFQSAVEALKFFQNSLTPAANLPDLIFLDIKMPIMSGFEFLDEFAKLPEAIISRSKIIMLSSSLDFVDYKKAISNPLVLTFVQKPLDKKELVKLKFEMFPE